MLPDTIHQAIKELRQELERIDYAIRQIEAVQEGKILRGRPPKHLLDEEEPTRRIITTKRS